MYPDLSYFFHDVFGTPVDNWSSVFKTFGLFLALTFIFSAWLLGKELLRMERVGTLSKLKPSKQRKPSSWFSEGWFNAAFFGFLLYKIPFISQHFAEFKRDPASIIFTSGGNVLLGIIGVAAVLGFFYWQQTQGKLPQREVKEWPHQKVGDIIMIAAITGLMGAKLFSIFENWSSFIQDPIGQFFSGSGLTIYGGLILATIVLVLYSKRIGIPTGHLADAAALCLSIGYGIGRMGCHFSGDGDWGIVSNLAAKPSWIPSWLWAYDYPRNVLAEGERMADCIGYYCYHLTEPVYPTPIYEITIAIITFAILWLLKTRLPKAGMLFFVYLFLTGLARFNVEAIRINDKYDLLGLGWSLSQWLAVAFMLIGIAGYFIQRSNGKVIEANVRK